MTVCLTRPRIAAGRAELLQNDNIEFESIPGG